MSTPEKPRPSIAETLSLIDDTLAAQTALPPLPDHYAHALHHLGVPAAPERCRCVVVPLEPPGLNGVVEATTEQAGAFTAPEPGRGLLGWLHRIFG